VTIRLGSLHACIPSHASVAEGWIRDPHDALVIHTTGGARLLSIAEVAVLRRPAAQAVMPMDA